MPLLLVKQSTKSQESTKEEGKRRGPGRPCKKDFKKCNHGRLKKHY